MIEEIKVPSLGIFEGASVLAVLAKVGDIVDAGDPLIEIGNETASVELGGDFAGLLCELRVAIGDTASENEVLALIDTEASATEIEASAGKKESATLCPGKEPPDVPAFIPRKPSAPPSARAQARQSGTADTPSGTGQATPQGGRIPVVPAIDFSEFGPVEEVPMARIQKVSGPALHRAWLNVPHVTHNDEADITELDLYRKEMDTAAREDGYQVTLLSFVVKAVVAALHEHWQLNSSLHPDGGKLIRKNYYHIGFAADTPNGLMVPVIRDADHKGIVAISKELGDLSTKAREGRLKATEMQGASFTISSLGGIGGTSFTPIVNTPEVAILGLTRTRITPQWDGGGFVPRSMLPLSLSYDHRAIDGALAARFCVSVKDRLSDMRKLIW